MVNVEHIPHPRRWRQQCSKTSFSAYCTSWCRSFILFILVKTMTEDKLGKYYNLKTYFKIAYLITYLSTDIPCQNPEDCNTFKIFAVYSMERTKFATV
jgi:hypothetical protein